jgi:uncharacterized C2H2 Zn-finger protein
MNTFTLTDSQLSSLPSLQTNFTNNAFTKEYPTISIIASEKSFPRCIICFQIPEDPVSLCNKTNIALENRHLFCRKCSIDYGNSTCPTCNDSFTDTGTPLEDIQAKKAINDIKCNAIAICPKQCGNVLLLNKMETHLKICDGKQALSDRKLSTATGSNPIIQCPDCKIKLTDREKKDLAKHTNKCPESFVEYKPKSSMFPFLVVRKRLLNIDKYNEQVKNAINFDHSLLISKKLDLISLPIYEFSLDDKDPKGKQFTYADATVSINEQHLLVITTKQNKVCRYNFSKKEYYLDYENYKEQIPPRFRVKQENGFVPSDKYHPNLKYRFSIYAYLSATESVLVCQQAFTYSSIDTLNSMYIYNKSDTPQSFIDVKEFFTDNGLSKRYTDKLGKAMTWRIELVETTNK